MKAKLFSLFLFVCVGFAHAQVTTINAVLANPCSVLNTQNYPRFRFGISDEFKKGQQVDYVLGEWDEAEKAKLPERLEISSEIIRSFGTAGLENTMTTFNGK